MTRTIRSGSFRVDFLPNGDRIAHVVYVKSDDGENEPGWIELMRSVESSPEVVWPVSPPLQELHIEAREPHEIALLVGRAGKSHWSASIGFEQCPADEAHEQLVFDIACRVSVHPDALGSTYQLASGISYRENVRADESDMLCRFDVETSDGRYWRLCVDRPGAMQFDASMRGLTVVPQIGDSNRPATVRWRFLLQRQAN